MLVLAELLVRASPAWASEADLEAWEAGWWPAGNSAPSAEAWWEAPSASPSPPPFLLLSLPSWGSSCHMPPPHPPIPHSFKNTPSASAETSEAEASRSLKLDVKKELERAVLCRSDGLNSVL